MLGDVVFTQQVVALKPHGIIWNWAWGQFPTIHVVFNTHTHTHSHGLSELFTLSRLTGSLSLSESQDSDFLRAQLLTSHRWVCVRCQKNKLLISPPPLTSVSDSVKAHKLQNKCIPTEEVLRRSKMKQGNQSVFRERQNPKKCWSIQNLCFIICALLEMKVSKFLVLTFLSQIFNTFQIFLFKFLG